LRLGCASGCASRQGDDLARGGAGSAASYGVGYSEWVLRVLSPRPVNSNAHGFGMDTRAAEEALRESLSNRTVHSSLVEEPRVVA
jgi:hypothetical protein